MKLVVSFHGMCLCVLNGRRGNHATSATVLLLNGAAPSSRAATKAANSNRLPFHHPLMFVPVKHADLQRTQWSPVPAPETLIDIEGLVVGRHHAWSLSGLDLTLGRGKGVTLYENQEADDSGMLHNPSSVSDTRAWQDWRRIPDLSRIAKGATLRTGFRKIGRQVVGIVRFTGGELRGAPPKDVTGAARPWRFSADYTQVITDRFEFHCESPTASVNAIGFASGKRQALRMSSASTKPVRVVIVHEATPSATALGRATTQRASGDALDMPHYTAFYEAMGGRAVAGLQAPIAGTAYDSRTPKRSVDLPICPPAVFPQP